MDWNKIVEQVVFAAECQRIKITEEFKFPVKAVGSTGYPDSLAVAEIPTDVTIGELYDGRKAIAIRGSKVIGRHHRTTKYSCEIIFQRYVGRNDIITSAGPLDLISSRLKDVYDMQDLMEQIVFDHVGSEYSPTEDVAPNMFTELHNTAQVIVSQAS